MKKSSQYYEAMHAVLTTDGLANSAKLEILETLICDKNIAELLEKREAEKEDKE